MSTQTKTYSYSQTSDGKLNTDQLTLSLCNHFNESVSVENNQDLNIFKIHFFRILNEQDSYDVDNIVSNHIGQIVKLRILDLLDPQFSGVPAHKIDFRKYLQINTHAQKDVKMHLNGRPEIATYTYNGEKIARIRFEYNLNAIFLVYRRREYLAYYNINDELEEEFTISDEIYDLGNSDYHLTKATMERTQSRNYVIENMKAILNVFILNHYMYEEEQELMEALDSVTMFFIRYSDYFTGFLQTGAGGFKQKVIDDTEFAFLNLDMTGIYPGTVRDYVVMRISNA